MDHLGRFWVWCWLSLLLFAGCNSTPPYVEPWVEGERESSEEVCDGRDNNLDGQVDEGFRNAKGVYFTSKHCGACRRACVPDARSVAVTCAVDGSGARCVATECALGYALDEEGHCVSSFGWLCAACTTASECGRFPGADCFWIGAEQRCSLACQQDGDCASGYSCLDGGVCQPKNGSCRCVPGASFEMACSHSAEGGAVCPGLQRCENGVLSPCALGEEICDGLDNDCDGIVDNPFVDPSGAYSVDPRHCGGCGVDCTLNAISEYEVTCGGPATSPVCALLCPDTLDGVQVGDAFDADLDPSNGCECEVTNVDDAPASTNGFDVHVDENCDGADGVAVRSFYVAPWGAKGAAGSPIQPLSSISEALAAAVASLATEHPRTDIYVAAGTYDEVLVLENLEGVTVLGGYRSDFLYRDSSAYPTVLAAPAYDAPGAVAGAALVVRSCGKSEEVLVEGLEVRGAGARGPLEHAIGAFVEDSGSRLVLRDLVIRSGDAGSGIRGVHGEPGASPPFSGGIGAKARAAVENSNRACIPSSTNTVAGGSGGSFSCGAVATSGGNGGSSACPQGDGSIQPEGLAGRGVGAGQGGHGGTDCRGPLRFDNGCPSFLCCGLADFLVPSEYEVAQDGGAGQSGPSGNGGLGCSEGVGALSSTGQWSGIRGSSGTEGRPGSGGGGGGAGGGARIDWYPRDCEFADGLGGGGGGGGAGGCGGTGGSSGWSGAPSIGIAVLGAGSESPVRIEECTVHTGSGGRGGDGGNGGLPGKGSPGGKGGDLQPQERITPTLAGPTSGGHGGQGGDGGGGGGGGGGCGGSVVGIWTVGLPQGSARAYGLANDFALGSPGQAGLGGGGARNGNSGAEGRSVHVVAH